jgi:hypothetical protein
MSEENVCLNPTDKSRILKELKTLTLNNHTLTSAILYCEHLKSRYGLSNKEVSALFKQAQYY